jgi:hypothetical protein
LRLRTGFEDYLHAILRPRDLPLLMRYYERFREGNIGTENQPEYSTCAVFEGEAVMFRLSLWNRSRKAGEGAEGGADG